MTMPIKINEKTNINTKKWVKCRYKPKNPHTKWLNIQLSEHDIGNRSLSKESEIEKKKNCLYNIIMSSEHFWFYHDILFSCRIFFSPYVLLSIPSPSPFCPIISIIVLWALNPMCSAQNNNNNINNSQTSTKWFDATTHGVHEMDFQARAIGNAIPTPLYNIFFMIHHQNHTLLQ